MRTIRYDTFTVAIHSINNMHGYLPPPPAKKTCRVWEPAKAALPSFDLAQDRLTKGEKRTDIGDHKIQAIHY